MHQIRILLRIYPTEIRFDIDNDVFMEVAWTDVRDDVIASDSSSAPHVGHFGTSVPTDFLLTRLVKLALEAERLISSRFESEDVVRRVEPFDVIFESSGLFGVMFLWRIYSVTCVEITPNVSRTCKQT